MGEIFSDELTLQICLIWMQSTVWYFKWRFQSCLKHTTEFTHSEKSLKYTHSNVCYICRLLSCDSNAHALRCVTPYAPIMWSHTALSNSQKVSKRTGRKVKVCVYGCICVGLCVCVCVCIIVYVWVFVYVYMVLFLWVGLCMHVWPFQQYKLSLQERCMIRENDVTLISYITRFKTELNCGLNCFSRFCSTVLL